MRKLKTGFKDRSAKDVDVDGVTFKLKPMSQEIMTSFAMYTSGIKDTMLSAGQKKEFVKSHVVGWSDMYFEDGEELEYSDAVAVEYLTHDDYDDIFMVLYWKSIELAGDREKEIQDSREKAKK